MQIFILHQKLAVENQLDTFTAHPLHGEQLYLIVLALKKSLNVLEHRCSACQVPRGPLTHYTKQDTLVWIRRQHRNTQEIPLKSHSFVLLSPPVK